MNPCLTLRRASHASPVAIALLVAVNAVPLVGVLFLGWDLITLLAIYWAENGVVGLYAIGRILTAGRPIPLFDGRRAALPKLQPPPASASMVSPGFALAALVAFFCVHYGVFWFVHGIFVWVMLPMFARLGGDPTPTIIATGDPVQPFELVSQGAGPELGAVLTTVAFLLVSHGVSFLVNWLARGEHLTSTPIAETRAPYTRVVILHMTILLGAFGVALFGAGITALVVLVVLKTAVDVGAHLAERHRAADRAPAAPRPVPEGLDAPVA